MKNIAAALLTFTLLAAPLAGAFAKLNVPTGLDSIPVGAKSAPPCARGDIFYAGICLDRSYGNVIRTDLTRGRARLMGAERTHRSQKEDMRSFNLHQTGVRAAKGNGFRLTEPNSRQYQRSATQIQLNLRELRIDQRKRNRRVDATPRAQASTRTKQRDYFWNPQKGRVRYGLNL